MSIPGVLWRSLPLLAVLMLAHRAHAGDVYVNPKFPITGDGNRGRTTLSPPVIADVNACATHVYVVSFMPKATVKVILNGVKVIGVAAPHFAFSAIPLSQPLKTGDKLTATQTVNGLSSAPSHPPTIVGAMPSPLPAPSIDTHIYACGHVVDVDGLLPGVTVSVSDVTAGGAVIGNGFTPNDWGSDWDPVVTSSLPGGDQVTATQASCIPPASHQATLQTINPDPSPVLAPTIDPPIVGNDALTVHGLYTGAGIQAFDHAMPIGFGFATGSDNWMSVPPISTTALISAQQSLCTASTPSTPQTPVNTIAPPVLRAPICPGQPSVKVGDTTVDATLVLLKNGLVVGNGGAAPGDVPLAIAPPSTFAEGDQVSVSEYIGTTVSPGSNVVTVNCAPQNVVTQHNDNARDGAQLHETTLGPANVSSPRFGLLYDRHVLGTLLAQPLYVHGAKVNGSLRNIVVVATAEDVVYAFDADDTSADTTINVTVRGTAVAESTKWLWRTALGTPDTSTICGETDPAIVGITSTPVIDVSAATVYVVARDQASSGASGYDYLHALDLTTGADLRKVQVAASDAAKKLVFNHACQRQRPGLLLQNGTVYLGYGTYTCDAGCSNNEPYRGWIIGYNGATFAAAGEFTNSMAYDEGGMGVWASGNGLAGTEDGSIFYQTGNDIDTALASLGDSFVKLHGDGTSLSLVSQYRPPNAANYRSGDTDLGAGGPMLLPNGKLIGGGKDGMFYVLSQSDLASGPANFQAFYNTFHFGPGAYPYNSPTIYATQCPYPGAGPYGVADIGVPCYIDPVDYKNGESYGPNIHTGPVLWQYKSDHAFIYKMSEKDYLKSFDYDITSGTVNPTPAFVATVRPGADGMPGGFSSVSANHRTNGIVWTVVQQANGMYGPPTPAILYAHDATNLKELWNNAQDAAAFAKFTAPTIADGRVFLPSFNLFHVYGLARKAGQGRSIRNLPLQAALRQKWLNMGGAQGLLGEARSDEPRKDGTGLSQDFHNRIAGGGYGRVSVPPSVTIEAPMCESGRHFERDLPIEASIFANQRTGVHYVIGEIRSLFLREGGVKRFGYPLTDEIPTPDGLGLMTRFERATIYWYAHHNAEIGEPKPPKTDRRDHEARQM